MLYLQVFDVTPCCYFPNAPHYKDSLGSGYFVAHV